MESTVFKDFIRESFTPPIDHESCGNSKDRRRIEFFDLAKGVCIILVVLFHTDSAYHIPNFDALRMPLYFVLSGFFFKAYNAKTFLIKKINNILIPFLFWLFVSDILRGSYYHYTVDLAIVQLIKNPLYRSIDCNFALWFLICLFVTNIIFYVIYHIARTFKRICIIVAFLASVGYLFFRYNIKLPYWIDNSLIALPFFFFGYYCRNLSYLKPRYSVTKSLLWGIGFIMISYGIYYTFDHAYINITESSFSGSPIMSYLNSIAFVMGVLFLCKVIKWLPIVSYFGRYSIIVLCIHFPILSFLPKFAEKYLGYEASIVERTIFTILVCWLAIPICKRWLPYFVAQKPLFKVNSLNDQK